MNEDFRKHPPAPLAPVPFNIPSPEIFSFGNGLKVVVVEDRRFPFVSIRLGIRNGDINDPENETGVTSAMAALLTEGTEKYSSRELAEKIENLGADLAVGAGFDNTVLRVSTLSVNLEEIVKLVGEVLLRPVFPENELALYKQNAIEGLKYQRSQPDFLADQQVARIIYGAHPYSVTSPSEEDFEGLTREGIVAAYNRSLIPNNAVLVAVGNVSASELADILERELSGWEPSEVVQTEFAEPPGRDSRSLTIVDRPGSTQSNIVLANLAINRSSEDYFKVLLMNQVLGAGASSRLFMNLREDKGYTYGAYSKLYARRHCGTIEATSEVRTAVTGDSLKEFFYELERIREEPASEEEIGDAKNYLSGVFPIRAETQGGLVGLISAQQMYGLPEDYLDTYRENIQAVSVDDIADAARRYVQPDAMAIVIVGDTAEILSQARPFAEDVEVFDSEGKEIGLSAFSVSSDADPIDISGDWELVVDAQGQELPISVTFSQSGNALSGELASMLGDGSVRNGSVTGNRFSAEVVSEFQGQELEMSLKGSLVGEAISGTISVPMMPAPLGFKGLRRTPQRG